MTLLLTELFNKDFSECADNAAFRALFFAKTPGLAELKRVFDVVSASEVTVHGKTIPACLRITGRSQEKAPFILLAQLHGNEPAGLSAILLALALAQAGKLERDIIGVIGNPLAARQYFTAWAANPGARQETRDAYRCGLDEHGNLLPDMNRIPIDALSRPPVTTHERRAQELHWLGQHCSGIADLHSARGNMVCITDHKHDSDLRNTPIRVLLTGLAEAIAAHASSASAHVQTFKTILHPLPNIESQTGIEAGRHEAADAPAIAARFTLALLHTLGISHVAPEQTQDDGRFTRYHVQPRLTYADLLTDGAPKPGDRIYMAKACTSSAAIPERSDAVIIRKKDGSYRLQTILQFLIKPEGELAYAIYQYDEMEAVEKDAVVAVAIPSGITFKAPSAFSVLFISKARALYDKDPAVGPWPVSAEKLAMTKFCYPCEVSKIKLDV